MTLTELVIYILAVSHAVELFRHAKIPLIAGIRARMEASWVDAIHQLATCMFCFSMWVGIAAALVWGFGFWLSSLIVYALALTRGANLLNDLTRSWCRTPNHDRGD